MIRVSPRTALEARTRGAPRWIPSRLELDGVDLLPGAVEEPLAEVVPALVGAVAALHAGRRRLAQVSLAEAHLELVLRRAGAEVELQVASLARPARLLRPPVRRGRWRSWPRRRGSAARVSWRTFPRRPPGRCPRRAARG